MTSSFAIIIVTHGRPDLLARTLASLGECSRPDSYRRTLIIENGRRCGAEGVVRAADGALAACYAFSVNPSKSASLNRALAECDTDWAVFFDDDVRFDPQALRVYADAIKRHGDGHYFGGWTGVDREIEPADWLVPFLPDSAKGFSLPGTGEAERPGRFFMGFNWAARVRDMQACGGFDESIGPGTPVMVGDESLVQDALHRHGLRGLYLPAARVWHYVPASRVTREFALRRAWAGGYSRALLAARERGLASDGASCWSDARMTFRRRSRPALRANLAALPFVLRYQLDRLRGFRAGARDAAVHMVEVAAEDCAVAAIRTPLVPGSAPRSGVTL